MPRVLTLLALLFTNTAARAEPAPASDSLGAANAIPQRAEHAADSGALLPYTGAARNDAYRALVLTAGGYDTTLRAPTLAAHAQARVVDRVSFRAGFRALTARHEVRPEASVRVDVIRQEQAGFDLSASAGYEAHGFNTAPAVAGSVALSRRLGRLSILGSVAIGVGTEQNERYGALSLAATRRLLPALQVGWDTRLRMDLERDEDEPENEPDWDAVSGPLLVYSKDWFVLRAGAAACALKYRFGSSAVGVNLDLGLGAVF